MLKFQLFRLHVFYPQQPILPMRETLSREEILRTAVFRLYLQSDEDSRWKIGNVKEIENDFIYFRIGRRMSTNLGDYVNHDFIDDLSNPAIYTHVFVDTHFEVCAICRNTALSPYTTTIANQLAKLMNNTYEVASNRIKIKIRELIDPTEFMTMIHNAYAVTKFWCFFPRPNAFDVEEDLLKPGQRAIDHARAEKGKVELFGYELDKTYVEELTRSVTSLGEMGGAKIIEDKGSKAKNIAFNQNPVILEADEVSEDSSRLTICQRLREYYERLRHRIP